MPVIVTTGPTEIVTLAQVKAHCNIPESNTKHDAELDLIRLAAQENVESLIGPVMHQVVSETLTPRGGGVLLSTFPVVSVDSLTASGVDVTGYTLGGAGVVTGLTSSGTVSVTYTVGRLLVPASVKIATLIIAEHLWDTQRGNAPSALPTALDADIAVPFGAGFAIPNRAAELLAPFMLPPGVA